MATMATTKAMILPHAQHVRVLLILQYFGVFFVGLQHLVACGSYHSRYSKRRSEKSAANLLVSFCCIPPTMVAALRLVPGNILAITCQSSHHKCSFVNSGFACGLS